ncbi:hypothetical protein BC826DRAFT_993607 [Russula brevipes]|nr:hypothetical protein BC826DRAFT_993607 [Russula brevipes]
MVYHGRGMSALSLARTQEYATYRVSLRSRHACGSSMRPRLQHGTHRRRERCAATVHGAIECAHMVDGGWDLPDCHCPLFPRHDPTKRAGGLAVAVASGTRSDSDLDPAAEQGRPAAKTAHLIRRKVGQERSAAQEAVARRPETETTLRDEVLWAPAPQIQRLLALLAWRWRLGGTTSACDILRAIALLRGNRRRAFDSAAPARAGTDLGGALPGQQTEAWSAHFQSWT